MCFVHLAQQFKSGFPLFLMTLGFLQRGAVFERSQD